MKCKPINNEEPYEDSKNKICYRKLEEIMEGYYADGKEVKLCDSNCRDCEKDGGESKCTACHWNLPYLVTTSEGGGEQTCNRTCAGGYIDESDITMLKCYTDKKCHEKQYFYKNRRTCYSFSKL